MLNLLIVNTILTLLGISSVLFMVHRLTKRLDLIVIDLLDITKKIKQLEERMEQLETIVRAA